MSKLLNTMESFWEWTGLGNTWGDSELDISKVDPLYCPEFEELRNVCISLMYGFRFRGGIHSGRMQRVCTTGFFGNTLADWNHFSAF